MKTGILNTFDVLRDLSFDDEADLQWRNYNSPLHPELLEKQRKSLIDTGIKIGQDETLKFIYLSDIAGYEDIINETYNKIQVSDYKTSVCNEVFYTMKIEGAKTTLARTYEISPHTALHMGIMAYTIHKYFPQFKNFFLCYISWYQI